MINNINPVPDINEIIDIMQSSNLHPVTLSIDISTTNKDDPTVALAPNEYGRM